MPYLRSFYRKFWCAFQLKTSRREQGFCTIHRRAFVTAHFHRSSSISSHGLLLSRGTEHRPAFVAAKQGGGGIEVSELSYNFRSWITSSCNSLILASDEHKLFIVNPATKCYFDIPMFSAGEGMIGLGIAYSATFYSDDDLMLPKCNILTVGVDNAWRHVATQHLSFESGWLLLNDPFIAEGFMHWAYYNSNAVLTMNVETVVFAETPAPLAPIEYRVKGFQYAYMSTGRNLSVLFSCGKPSWEVWELKSETGKWSKLLPDIDCKSKIKQFGWKDEVFLIPNGWVKYPEVMLFFSSHAIDFSCLIYNLDNDEMDSVMLPLPSTIKLMVHRKSLLCLSSGIVFSSQSLCVFGGGIF